MEPNREPSNKPSYIWSSDLQHGCQDRSMEKRQTSTKSVGKTGYSHVNESYTTKINTKYTKDLNV